ncbi:helix-turn-helix domain-containing protein [Pantoea osteomyelitidis]|uniref:Helix-turn-helix domain-containing protein n=1 Tax=Pantoea osteomyelitidis TaxID=3230026 RepID=A0ABW7Q1K9_9GAMM
MPITPAKMLAHAIRNERKKQPLSQVETADNVGLKQATLSALENNPDGIRLDTLFKILSALNLQLTIVPRGQTKQHNHSDLGW